MTCLVSLVLIYTFNLTICHSNQKNIRCFVRKRMSFRNKYLRCVFLKTETHCCSGLTNLTESQEIITVLVMEIYLESAWGAGL